MSQLGFLDDSDITWYKFAGGTFFNLQSRKPLGYTVRCVTEDGHSANPEPETLNGEPLPVGEWYQSHCYNCHPPATSPIYGSIKEAKEACDYFELHGVFPPPE